MCVISCCLKLLTQNSVPQQPATVLWKVLEVQIQEYTTDSFNILMVNRLWIGRETPKEEKKA